MAFIENDTASHERFNLLLLEPGEIYFEDYSVYFYPSCQTENESIKRKQRGHLKICSKSIVFVPKENQYSILKFPMKDITGIEEYSGGLYSSSVFIKEKCLKVCSNVCVQMKKDNIISPYTFKKVPGDYLFSLNYVTVDDCLPQMCQLHRASTLPPADKSAMINAIVLSRQSRVTFNTSWLEDLYETIELECQADKTTPLVTNPGRVMLTSQRLYFQPFNNVDRVPVIKIKLREIKQIIKRRFLLKQIGLEIFCDSRSAHPHLYLSHKSQSDRDNLYDKIIAQKDVHIEISDQQDMTLRWQNGQISNYEYLMYLNSSADRSYFDLTQYPVMPWVIQDTTNDTLDLENPQTFRDLSKPIGALNKERLERMKRFYMANSEGQNERAPLENPQTFRDLSKPIGALNKERLERMKRFYMANSEGQNERAPLENPQTFRDLSKPIGALNKERLERMKRFYMANSEGQNERAPLENPQTFRDLSKPIGALNKERLERMKERYRDMPEPKFLYGAHYSTPGYVLFYLARMAPEYVLCLQNGKFDQPDRMFNSLYELWQNCLQGAADFKELIPEFYEGDGEFLVNPGISNFGIRQDGRPIGDVDIPPWASGPKDFVLKMREALECEYVSKHLHEWIDLIFGYKQRGEEAEKADNVFYYMTYEGAIDLDSIKDPNERACMEIQIMEFGQIPRQLFITPHPMRYGPRDIPRSLSTFSHAGSEDLDKSGSFGANEEPEADQESHVAKMVDFTSLQRKIKYTLHKDTVTDVKLCREGKCIFSVSQDSLLKMYSLEDQRQLRSVTMTSMALSSCLVMPDNKTVICGSWDDNVYFYSVEFGRLHDTLRAHEDAVSCICWSNDILITSSWDSTVKIWQFSIPNSQSGFVAAEYVNQLDHDSGVCHMAVDNSAEVLITGTMDGQICVWNLIHYYITSQHQVHAGKVNAIILSEDKHQIISCGEDRYLRITDLESGTELFVKDVKDTILCLALVNNILLSGTESGCIQVWDIDKATLIQQVEAHQGAVTCLQMSDDYCLISGGDDRSISLWRPLVR